MMLRSRNDDFVLSTGTRVYANKGILGISHTLNGISEGYDGGVTGLPGTAYSLTVDEQLEVVEYAQGLWEQYKQKLLSTKMEQGR